ncbi:MAG: hypothetical protein M1820_006219 [Bogoriella megaspora]|nr:MAG: hypothetical protein M1820_006219 [Bogoriella megaspora]
MDTTNLVRRRTIELEEKGNKNVSGQSHTNSSALLRVDQIYSRKDRQTHYVKTAKPGLSSAKNERLNRTTLVVRRIISSKGMVSGTEVDIKAPLLAEFMKQTFRDVDGLKLNKSPAVADPQLFFHAYVELDRALLEEKAKRDPSQQFIDNLSTAITFVHEDFGHDIENLAALTAHGEITFDLLWALFPPKSKVFTRDNILQESQVMECQQGHFSQTQEGQFYRLETKIINHDGQDFGYGTMEIAIKEFAGSKKITSLSAFPLKNHPDLETITEQLIQRGRKYVKLLDPSCQDYTGAAVEEVSESGRSGECLFPSTGRMMCDPVAYRTYNPYNDLMLRPWVPHNMSRDRLTEDELLLTHHRIQGYSLTRKRWGCFAVSKMADINWDDAEIAFEKLIMEPKRRNYIRSLVTAHRSDSYGFDDLIPGKGKGLVGLLSGSPGVGKTLTAELVAGLTHRPLYSISAGELGTTVEKVDDKLEMILAITHKWRCVLLIDEADVFLHARTDLDLTRNALISIFLRRLEYFQGVLIMTTNRKQAIDPAFNSRIHFKIHYPPLSFDDRLIIWKNFMSRVPPEVPEPELDDADFEDLAKSELNGREIKNATACAFSISRERKEALTKGMLLEILVLLVDREAEEE